LSAWFIWASVHLQFLATSSLRLTVFLQWIWTYVTGERGDRLIVDHAEIVKRIDASVPAVRASVTPTFAGSKR
jgi:hypothetical protein